MALETFLYPLYTMAANLLGRYIWEINTIAKSRHGLTLEELNEEWESCSLYDGKPIVRKTWYEHREQFKIQFHIFIECDKRTNRYYLAFNDTDRQPEMQEWLLNSFSVGNMLLQGKDLNGRILCEKIPSGYEYLTELIQAMRESKVIKMEYQSFYAKESQDVVLEPYCLKVFKQRWYITGRNTGKDALRTYALDRIYDMEITDKKFKMPKEFDAQELYDTVYGIILDNDKKVERIEINVYNGQADYFRSLPLHQSQRELSSTKDCTVFEYYLKPTYDFIQELLSHGPDVEVIHPQSLRQQMKGWIQGMAELYK